MLLAYCRFSHSINVINLFTFLFLPGFTSGMLTWATLGHRRILMLSIAQHSCNKAFLMALLPIYRYTVNNKMHKMGYYLADDGIYPKWQKTIADPQNEKQRNYSK